MIDDAVGCAYGDRVPRYYFHSADSLPASDLEGVLLADEAEARLEAMRLAGEILKSEPGQVWARGKWSVGVMDEGGSLLFTIVALAADARPLGYKKPPAPVND